MKVTKSARKAKPSAQKSFSKRQPDETRDEIAEALRNIIEAIKAEDDSTLIAVLMPVATVDSQPKEKKSKLGLLSPKELLRLQIVELIYGDDLMPQSVLEAVHMILANGLRMGDETGELIAGFFKNLLYPDEEMRKIIEAHMAEEEKSASTVRRRRSRKDRRPAIGSRKSKADC